MIALAIFVVGFGAAKAWDHIGSLKIPATEAITFFADSKNPVPLWSIDGTGKLIIDLPAAVRQYELNKKVPPAPLPPKK